MTKKPNPKLEIVPLHEYVLVERDPTSPETAGGIHLPERAREPLSTGIVVARGSHVQSPDIKIGDHVIFGEHAGIPLPLTHQDLLVMEENEILAVLREAKPDRSPTAL